MKEVFLSVKDARELDNFIINILGVESLILMENAGRSVVDLVEKEFNKKSNVAVFCGKGNNGGDGFVVARHLLTRGFKVEVYLAGKESEISKDAKTNLFLAFKSGMKINELNEKNIPLLKRKINKYNIIIDALLGIGIKNETRGMISNLIDLINNSLAKIISVDVPSGFDADNGVMLGRCVKSDFTVTFLAKKRGFLRKEAKDLCGNVIVENLGFPIKELLRNRR